MYIKSDRRRKSKLEAFLIFSTNNICFTQKQDEFEIQIWKKLPKFKVVQEQTKFTYIFDLQ